MHLYTVYNVRDVYYTDKINSRGPVNDYFPADIFIRICLGRGKDLRNEGYTIVIGRHFYQFYYYENIIKFFKLEFRQQLESQFD